MKKFLTLFIVSVILTCLFVGQNTLAEDLNCPYDTADECLTWSLNQTGVNAGYSQGDYTSASISEKIGTIISYILAFLGIFFLVITIYSGFQWMTAGGNEEKVKIARTRAFNAIIGLIIVMAAYAITYFVYNLINSASRDEPMGPDEPNPGYECTYNVDCLDPSEPYCAWYETHSFCTVCLIDSDCNQLTPYCITGPFGHFCTENIVECMDFTDCSEPTPYCCDNICTTDDCF